MLEIINSFSNSKHGIMKLRIVFFFIFSFFLLSSLVGQNRKWDNQLLLGEKNFEKGNYKLVVSQFEKLIKKQKKSGVYQDNYPMCYVMLSIGKEALGLSIEADSLLNLADSLWALAFKGHLDSTRLKGDLLFAKANLLLQNTIQARKYIDDGRSILSSSNDKRGFWKHEFNMLELKALELEMKFNEALLLKDSILEFQRDITTRKEKIYNEKKQRYVNKNIPKKEYKKRTNTMAYLKVVEADFYRLKGDYRTADSLYTANKKSLQLYVKKSNINTTRNVVGKALLERQMGEYDKSSRHLRKARIKFSNKIKYSFPNSYYFEIFREEILSELLAGDYNKYRNAAKQYRREAINSFSKRSTHYLTARRLLIEDDFLKGRYNRASKKAGKLLEVIDEYYPLHHTARKDLYRQSFDISVRNNDFSYAQTLSDQYLRLIELNFGKLTPAHRLGLLERAYFETEFTNDFKYADTLYSSNFDELVRKEYNEQHIDYLYFLNSYGKMYESTDRFDKALELYKEGVRNAEEIYGEESVEYGLQLEKVAGVQVVKGEYLLAEETLEQSVSAIKDDKAKISMAYVSALQTLASLYNINGKFELAQTTLKKAYRISKRLGDDTENLAVNSVEDLADVYIKTGRYDDAENILSKTLEIKRNKYGEEHFQLIDPYAQLGGLYLIKGDFISAEKNTRNALDITHETVGDTSIKYLDNLVLLADVYAAMGDNTKALNLYREGIRKAKNKFGEQHVKIADILVKKAKVMLYDSEISSDEVILELDKAASIVELGINNQHPKYAQAIELKAHVLVEEKKYEEALVLLEKANEIYKSTFGESHIKTADNRVLVANLYYRKGDFTSAIAFYEKAMSTYKKVFNKDHPKYVSTYSKLGQSHYSLGDYKKAVKIFNSTTETYLTYITQYFPSLSENEKAKYWNSIKGDFEIYNSLALNIHSNTPEVLERMYDNKLATKAILLNSSIKIKERIQKYGDPYLVAKYEVWVRKREQLTKAISMSSEELKLSDINKTKLQKEILLLEKELSESSEGFAQNFEKKQVDWKDVRSTLKPGEAAVELIKFNYFNTNFTDSVLYVALVIKESSKYPEIVVMDKGNELEGKYFKYYRNGIKYKAKDKYSYKKFWAKIDEKLSGISSIYLSVDGIYNQVNPETFRLKDGTFLIDKYTFYNVSNTKDLVLNDLAEKTEYKTFTATLFGNPKFKVKSDNASASARGGNKVSSVAPLPGAELEVKNLSEFLTSQDWETETYLTSKATESKVKDMESPRIFHVATHGFFMQEEKIANSLSEDQKPVENPLLKAGLLFVGADELLAENNIYQFNKKDGVLTAYEAMNLNLDNTELVVLSACETGLGEIKSGEGVYGLQRSFLVAGAQNVIMTLFKVNDEITQELMNDFYKMWFETGDKRQAFLQAKKNIKAKYDSPIYWGSFVLVGLD